MTLLSARREFRRFLVSEGISRIGTQITLLALPLTAIATLGAGPAALGILGVAEFIPIFLVTPLAGVLGDRMAASRIMVLANLARATVLAAIPLLSAMGSLDVIHIYAVAFLTGSCAAFFEVAYQGFPVDVLPAGELAWANSRLQATNSASEVAGPGLGGVLIGLLGAPYAVAFDALSFVLSASIMSTIKDEARSNTPRIAATGGHRSRDGFRVTLGDGRLRAIVLQSAAFNLFEQMILTLLLLYAVRVLGFSAPVAGLLFALGAVGALVGALLAQRLGRTVGAGRAMLFGMVAGCTAPWLIPSARGSAALAFATVAVGVTVYNGGVSVFNVFALSARQLLAPSGHLARVNATYRLLSYGPIPLGSALAGVLGSTVGIRGTLMVASGGLTLSCLAFAFTPVTRLRTLSRAVT